MIQTTRKYWIYIGIAVMIVVTIIVTAIHKPKSPDRKRSGTFSVDLPSSVAVNAFEVKNGWGYEILVNNDLLISQEFIPGFSGQQAFKTQADALKCGELVVQKIKQGKMPVIERHEIDSLCIQY